jgi:membrane associated rhomboid family serine protease
LRKEEKQLLISTLPGIFIIILMWSVHIIGVTFHYPLYTYGIYPRTAEGLQGVLLSVFLHADWKHLAANSLPILFLNSFLFYHYTKIAKESLIWLYILSGFWTWCLGRESYHIGASGLIYGLAFLIFTLGIIRKDRQSMALSLIIVFLYGGLFWGLFPIFKNVSWEAHLSGAIAGILLAIYFKKEYPKQKVKPEEEPVYDYEYWMVDENGEPLNPPTEVDNTAKQNITYNYIYIEKKDDDEKSADDIK